jgi:1,4-alpha-glucan branching enzyme
MGWMHDTLRYLGRDPIFRRHHQGELTFRMVYAWSERYVLPLSHDEVVHGKGSVLGRMPGDRWQQLANVRLLYGYQWGLPGKQMLFMGDEFAQPGEWNHDAQLDWGVMAGPEGGGHKGVQRWVARLNQLHRAEPALHAVDFSPEGFEWIDTADARNSVLTFLRRAEGRGRPILVVCNFTPVPRSTYKVGVPEGGFWQELASSDAVEFGGTGWGNGAGVQAVDEPYHGREHSLELSLPPLGVLYLASGAA